LEDRIPSAHKGKRKATNLTKGVNASDGHRNTENNDIAGPSNKTVTLTLRPSRTTRSKDVPTTSESFQMSLRPRTKRPRLTVDQDSEERAAPTTSRHISSQQRTLHASKLSMKSHEVIDLTNEYVCVFFILPRYLNQLYMIERSGQPNINYKY
jgi:hypothetical protein